MSCLVKLKILLYHIKITAGLLLDIRNRIILLDKLVG